MPNPEDVSLLVNFEHYLYESADGGFCVAQVVVADGAQRITVVGALRGCAQGESLRLRGAYQEHAKYGRRFRVMSFSPVMPTTIVGIAKFLGSGLIDGIGAGLAGRLVSAFGERTLDVIEREPSRLREV